LRGREVKIRKLGAAKSDAPDGDCVDAGSERCETESAAIVGDGVAGQLAIGSLGVNGSPVHWLAVVANHGTRDGARCRWTLRGEAGTGNEGNDHQEAQKSPRPSV
jgi:hypothetical protein